MKRDLHNDYFEVFLKQNADELYMRPSAKVWRSISNKINRRRRWFGFGLGTILISSLLITYYSVTDTTPAAQPDTNTPSSHQTRNTATSPVEKGNNNATAATLTKTATSKDNTLLPGSIKAASVLSAPPATIAPDANSNGKTVLTELLLSPTLPMAGAGLYNKLYKNSFTTAIIAYPNSAATDKIAVVKNSGKKHKLSWQFVFAPNISYRKLTENKSFNRASPVVGGGTNAPFSLRSSIYNINSAVTHKPNMGLEIGLVANYALSKNFALRSGVQFNMNRYEVKAFNYIPELTTISLNNRYLPDSVSALSSYRNYNGYGNDWLQNLYLQLSVPVGFEVNLHGDDKFQFGIASTIQPTYVLGDRVYLLSTDYKHYAQIPWLIRRWNVNTSFETFISYSSGHLRWQVGPEVRYQLLSSFINKYPVKENLFDFGLKVGISVNK